MTTANDVIDTTWAKMLSRFIAPGLGTIGVATIAFFLNWGFTRVIATQDKHGELLSHQAALIQRSLQQNENIQGELKAIQEQNLLRFATGTERFDKIERALERLESRVRELEVSRGARPFPR